MTSRSVGSNGGQVAAFAYDLAASVVYARQRNPAWAAQERDGFEPICSDDKFFGRRVAASLVWQGQDPSYIVRDGDTIDRAYRVETINEHAVILTYLPLQQQQTLALGEGN